MNNGRIDAQNNGLTHDPASVNPNKGWTQNVHQFDNSYKHLTTERYADISPFMVMDVIDGDTVPFTLEDNVRTYTMQAPLEDDIFKHRFYSLVPMRAILPNTWKLFYTNPTKGDDVPEDVYCNLDIVQSWKECFSQFNEDTASLSDRLQFIVASELLFSTGGLPSKLKCNLWPYMYNSKSDNLDILLDHEIYPVIIENAMLQIEVQPNDYIMITASETLASSLSANYVDVHTFLDYLRSYNYARIYVVNEEPLSALWGTFVEHVNDYPITNDSPSYKIDMSRFIAYQISCVSQASDTSVDYIFNAQLFRNILFCNDTGDTFSYNGSLYLYDTFSNIVMSNLWFNGNFFNRTVSYLFNYQKSLKFSDYFVTARPERLAIGDISIDATGDSVNSLDVARKLVYTRFLNWNNRVGPKYEDYKKSLTGVDAMPDPTEPAFINHSLMVVKGYDVENTGAEQFSLKSVSSIVNMGDTSREFEIFVTEPSILLGMASYDVQRIYTRGLDRSYLKEDRFDYFNNRLQYTGDQDIKALEIDITKGDGPIAYTTKDMHYKMQVSHANGGFIFALPSWAMTTENDTYLGGFEHGINPEFIRNQNGPFDIFFGSLSGLSLGTYFHFICRYKNILPTQRPMDVAPDIL